MRSCAALRTGGAGEQPRKQRRPAERPGLGHHPHAVPTAAAQDRKRYAGHHLPDQIEALGAEAAAQRPQGFAARDDQGALGDPVALAPKRFEAVRVLDDFPPPDLPRPVLGLFGTHHPATLAQLAQLPTIPATEAERVAAALAAEGTAFAVPGLPEGLDLV